jgi:hypothetical protein
MEYFWFALGAVIPILIIWYVVYTVKQDRRNSELEAKAKAKRRPF